MSLKVMYIALVAFAARGATTPDRVMDDKKIRTAVNCHLDEKCPSEDYYGAIGSWDTSRAVRNSKAGRVDASDSWAERAATCPADDPRCGRGVNAILPRTRHPCTHLDKYSRHLVCSYGG